MQDEHYDAMHWIGFVFWVLTSLNLCMETLPEVEADSCLLRLTSRLWEVKTETFGVLREGARASIQLCPVKDHPHPVGHQAGKNGRAGRRGGVQVEDVPTEPVVVGVGPHRVSPADNLDVVRSAAVPLERSPPGVLAAHLEALSVEGGVAEGAVTSLRPDTDAVELVGQMAATVVVVRGDCPRGPCEILQAASKGSPGGAAGDLHDVNLPGAGGGGGVPAEPQGIAVTVSLLTWLTGSGLRGEH